MEHDHLVLGRDLVDQMSRPEHADVLLGAQPADVLDDRLARADVEADGRLVEQQELRPVQQRAGDLDPAQLPARELADLVAGALGELEAGELGGRAPLRLAARDALQPRGVEQVLHDREIEVDGALLEHHAERGERLRGPPAHVGAEDPDAAAAVAVEPGDQVEQRGLAGAVLAEQHGEAAGRDRERDLVQHLARAEAVAQASDLERGRRRFGSPCGLRHR